MAPLEEDCTADTGGEAAPGGFAVREFPQLDWTLKAFHGKTPISCGMALSSASIRTGRPRP